MEGGVSSIKRVHIFGAEKKRVFVGPVANVLLFLCYILSVIFIVVFFCGCFVNRLLLLLLLLFYVG